MQTSSSNSQVNTVLCADSQSLREPWLMGLPDEALDAQPWLKVLSNASQVRSYLREHPGISDAWIASSDTVDGINLAAAVKRDSTCGQVSLIAFGASGSLVGRCQAAGVHAYTDRSEFMKHYGWKKQDFQEAQHLGIQALPTQQMASVELEEPPVIARVETEAPREFLMPPQQPQGIWAQFARMGNASSAQGGAVVLAVLGTSGGVGRSSVAALAGMVAQAQGSRTLVVDADFQFGDMATILDVPNALDASELLANPEKVERLVPEGRKPALLAAPSRIEQSEVLGPQLEFLLGVVKPHFDVVVVNTGAFWQEHHLQLIEHANYSLLLCDQRPSTVRGAAKVFDLCANCGVPTRSLQVVLNRCARKAPMSAMDVSCALHGEKVAELREGGMAVSQALGAGMPAELLSNRNEFAQSLRELLKGMLPENTGALNVAAEDTKTRAGRTFRKKRA